MSRTLVTGATGFIGYEVARHLAASGAPTRLMVRRPERGALLRRLGAELISADLTSPASLSRAVQGVDVVLHLGARAAFESYSRVRPTIVDGSVALLEAARAAGVKTFVYASSLLVYGDQKRSIGPQTPEGPRVDYGRAKREAEEALVSIAHRTDMQLAVVRLPHVYGARDLLFERIHRGLLLFAGRGDNPFAHMHVEDAARLLIEVAKQGWTGISPVADDHPATWNEFFEVIRLHYPRFRQIRVPGWLGASLARLVSPVLALRSHPTMLTPDTVTGWNLRLPVEEGLLWRDLGLSPLYPTIDSGIPAVLDDCVAFRWLHPLLDTARY